MEPRTVLPSTALDKTALVRSQKRQLGLEMAGNYRYKSYDNVQASW